MSGSTSEVLARAIDTLETAACGLRSMQSSDPRERMAGLRNVVVFGRAVTNVLQNLRSSRSDFDVWYQPKVDEMRQDPLLRRFYELRSQILKVGTTGTRVSVSISNLVLPQDASRFGPPPPGATAFFIGDQLGGTGWEVPQPDGSIEKFYVEFPPDMGAATVELAEPPDSHLGQPLTSTAVLDLATAYVAYLRSLVNEARERFAEQRSA